MNIFYVDTDPVVAAQSLVDKHVVKMILETAQLLSTAHRVLDGNEIIVEGWVDEFGIKHRKKKLWKLDDDRDSILYLATHINHPSAVWCRQSISNYAWLVDHMFALGAEYTHRYNKRHATIEKLGYALQSPPFNLCEYELTKMPSAMDTQYIISDDSIVNYRNYYRLGKSRMHKWTKREVPEWIR